ncbi:MAG: class I SAM-dependent methyltransferase [Deltaproteobacteria bacterium]|nr:class I SAM-dependent methyltransferase [Deltaproteobacteria bacterium]MBN2687808.1 class I SAM-dependent methyltransferase [Deltaproteobacteria bacterium]
MIDFPWALHDNLSMNVDNHDHKIIDVFGDVDSHRVTAEIIRTHSTNRRDIRDVALEGLDLSSARKILELGCGFGFFTESLKGRVSPDARITGIDVVEGYSSAFMEACARAEIGGTFIHGDVSVIRDFEESSFDAVICSYSLYFFPHIIGEIARILNDRAVLVATVHNGNSMKEFVDFARDVLIENGIIDRGTTLHIESLITSFSSENGCELLRPWFGDIRRKTYENTLVFEPVDMYLLMEYFRFKRPFFLSALSARDVARVFDLFEIHLQRYFNRSRNGFSITKDDTIFICSRPMYQREKR